eukprot:3650951-Prymnesium_polylepis.1
MTASAHVPAQHVNVECSQHDGSNGDSNRRGEGRIERCVDCVFASGERGRRASKPNLVLISLPSRR